METQLSQQNCFELNPWPELTDQIIAIIFHLFLWHIKHIDRFNFTCSLQFKLDWFLKKHLMIAPASGQCSVQLKLISWFQWHEANRSISAPPCMGCRSNAGLPSSIKSVHTHIICTTATHIICTTVERGTNRRVKRLAIH